MANQSTIARLEHDTDVVPLGSDPKHCDGCRQAIRQRDCSHSGDLIDERTMCDPLRLVCADCGAQVDQ